MNGIDWNHFYWNHSDCLVVDHLPKNSTITIQLKQSNKSINKNNGLIIQSLLSNLKQKQKSDQLECNNLNNLITTCSNQLVKSTNSNLKLQNKLSSLRGLLNKLISQSHQLDHQLQSSTHNHSQIKSTHSLRHHHWLSSIEKVNHLKQHLHSSQSQLQTLSLKASKLKQRKLKFSSHSIPNLQSQLDNNTAFNRLYSSSSSLNSPSTFSPWSDTHPSTQTDSLLPFPGTASTHISSYPSFHPPRTRTTSHPSFFYNHL